MSNKLKTISVGQFEHLISKAVSEYVNEECECKVTNLDTADFDYEDNVGVHEKRKVSFDVTVSYKE
ncbi:MAG: hypothetical protein WEA56_01550 [Balneolaceae bacterium]